MTKPMYSLMAPQEDEYRYVEQTYSGFDDSAVFCMAPMNYQRFFHKNLGGGTGITGYSCPVSSLPYSEFPGWDDPLAYSPLCRGWYISQKKFPNQNLITEAYLWVNEPLVGISVCAPFFMKGYDGIFGTNCLDVTPVGDLNDYFNLDETLDNRRNQEFNGKTKDQFFVINNPDPQIVT